MTGLNQLDAPLRIKLGDRVIDIREFEVSFVPGMVRMEATDYRLHGSFDEPTLVVSEAPQQALEEKPETPVITREQILKSQNITNNGQEHKSGSDQ